MPYPGELASKAAHAEIIRNPDVAAFLQECAYLTPPSDEECQMVANRFVSPPDADVRLPSFVVAVDGSNYESSIDDKLPSTKIGYIKIGAILIDLEKFGTLREGRFVDPFRVAELQNNNSALTFSIPSANIRWGNKPTVRESFRALLDQQFYGPRTRFNEADPTTSLRSTLFYLASRRPGEMGTGDSRKLKIYRCPQCGEGPIEVEDVPDQQHCPFCGSEVYPTDCLRLWEEVQEYQSNRAAMTRVMMILEHLIPFHYIRFLYKTAPLLLSGMAFFVDGPLAIFGTAAWLHRSFMIFLQEVNRKLARHNCLPLLVVGLQKTGQIIDHISLIDRFVPNDRLFAIDDVYRYRYILAGHEASRNGFGFETYYGQDFIYKTPTGRTFALALPYPYASKEEPGVDFVAEKVRFERYAQLPAAIQLINLLESDLYKNAVVPIALAHRYTAISLQPGGKVLDLLTRRALQA
jgi:hypothetical protein